MKVYMFYRKYKNNGLIPNLYAFTTNKTFYDEFKRIRNMDSFIIRKEEYSEDFIDEFVKKYKKYELKYRYFETYNRDILDKTDSIEQSRYNVKILSTEHEEYHIYSRFDDILMMEMGKLYALVDDNLFNKEIRNALKALKANDIINFYREKRRYEKLMDANTYGLLNAQPWNNIVEPSYVEMNKKGREIFLNDYFGLFIKEYKWSF